MPIKFSVTTTDADRHAETLSRYFKQFYARPPFGEIHWTCSGCSPPENPNLGLDVKYDSPGICTVCGTDLEEFWSANRIGAYLRHLRGNKEDFRFYAAESDGSLVGWIWGFKKDDEWYIDFIGADRSHRRKRWMSPLVSLLTLASVRLRRNFVGRLSLRILRSLQLLGPTLFAQCVHDSLGRGYAFTGCRTHSEKAVLLKHMKFLGFKPMEPDVDHPDRIFFRLAL